MTTAVDMSTRMFAGAVNTYASSPLRGCIADAEAIMRLFAKHGGWPVGQARLQFNDQMKNDDVREALDWVTAPGVKRSVMTLSGHGGRRPRATPGAKDPTEEFYCPFNIDSIWSSPDLANDAYLEKKFGRIEKGGKNIFFGFMCHSGGASNTQIDDAAAKVMEDPTVRVKYLRGPWDAGMPPLRPIAAPKAFRRAEDNVFVDNDSDYVWFAAARSDQYSYDVSGVDESFDASRKALEEVVKMQPGASIRTIHRRVVEWIVETYGFDQTPQLWGPDRLLDSDFFS
jgi:hypothetical protein